MTIDREWISQIEGPILVTGAGGFIGAHLLSALQSERSDAFGTVRTTGTWRTQVFGLRRTLRVTNSADLDEALRIVQPRTIFNLAAHGAYSFQNDPFRIVATNFSDVIQLADWAERNDCAIIQAGSSSEYGWNSAGPKEGDSVEPNSLYAVTKVASSNWLQVKARVTDLPIAVLRLYSVYGPGEDPARLFPTLVRLGLSGQYPPFAASDTSRDFVYIDDAVAAFLRCAALVRTTARGMVFNIGSGERTAMSDLAHVVGDEFDISDEPQFGSMSRAWDLSEWYSDPTQASTTLGWRPQVELADGLRRTREWYAEHERTTYLAPDLSVGGGVAAPTRAVDVSAIVACYRDAQAIPFMYSRLRAVFESLGLTFEIIFVNDCSPDDTLGVIEGISHTDDRVIGITHARNFGSQAAFLSGLRQSTGDHAVLLDGDLQDPPELIAEMWAKKLEGFDVVYGRRVDREAPWFMRRAYKGFYRVFQALAPFEIPRDAGDFSLMSRPVIDALIAMPERDLFLRAQRAYVGFRQTGVDYKRPERMFGTSTNNLRKNFGWATRGVLAVSRAPLTGLSVFALFMFLLSLVAIFAQVVLRFVFPDSAPAGWVSLWVVMLGIGSLNLLAIAVVGEYVGRILEESKKRPRFVRRAITQGGVTRATDNAQEGVQP